MSKDPFQLLVDEITLIRGEVASLRRTSLDKEEAEALHGIVARAVKDMRKATSETPAALQDALKADRDQMAHNATVAATQAAQSTLEGIRAELAVESEKLSQRAREARRATLRFSGGIWTLLAATLVTGAFLGLLTAYVTETAETFFSVDRMTRYACGLPGVGGQVVEMNDGATYCAHWIITPELAKYRREQPQQN